MEEDGDTAYWPQVVLDTISGKGQETDPWLTFHYIFDPIGHTVGSHNSDFPNDLTTYTQYFLEKADILKGDVLPNLIKSIQSDDPESIVFVFGDHGPWLSRTTNERDEPEFFILDRYGVFGALLATEHPCNESDIAYYDTRYTTPERVVSGIIRCLSQDPELVDRAMSFDEPYDFRNYVYE